MLASAQCHNSFWAHSLMKDLEVFSLNRTSSVVPTVASLTATAPSRSARMRSLRGASPYANQYAAMSGVKDDVDPPEQPSPLRITRGGRYSQVRA
eukprot:scaffold30601_cov32-Prasinocladus_malaysianus.AAC.1